MLRCTIVIGVNNETGGMQWSGWSTLQRGGVLCRGVGVLCRGVGVSIHLRIPGGQGCRGHCGILVADGRATEPVHLEEISGLIWSHQHPSDHTL